VQELGLAWRVLLNTYGFSSNDVHIEFGVQSYSDPDLCSGTYECIDLVDDNPGQSK